MRRAGWGRGVMVGFAVGLSALGLIAAWRARRSAAREALPPAALAAPPERTGSRDRRHQATRRSGAAARTSRRAPAASGASLPGAPAPARCSLAIARRREPAFAEAPARPGEGEDSTRPEAVARYLAQRGLQREPKYRLAAASAALWFFRELRTELAEVSRAERSRAAAGGGPPEGDRSELQGELRQLEEAAEAIQAELRSTGWTPLACEDPLVQKAALCAGFRRLGAYPSDSSAEAVEHFCSSDEMRALAVLVQLGERAPYLERAPRVIVNLAYHLDHPYVVARSAETCLGSARYRSFVEGRLREAPRTERSRGDTLLRALDDSQGELTQAGLEPLHCDEPEVQAVIRCVVQAGVTGQVGPRCRSPELQAALVRLRRG